MSTPVRSQALIPEHAAQTPGQRAAGDRGWIVVVGAGIVGAAVFHQLAARHGARVLLLEQSVPAFGATGFSGGIVRAFHPEPELAEDCARGVDAYAALVRRHGADFAPVRTGFVQLVATAQLESARRVYEQLGARFDLRWLEPRAAAQRFGLASSEGLAAAVLEPGAGYVDPRRVTMRWLALGQAAGGRVRTGVELAGLDRDPAGHLLARTGTGSLACERVVLCAGAWTPRLLDRLGLASPVPLRAKAIQVNCMAQAGGPQLPAFVDGATGAYGRPDVRGTVLVGCPVDEWDLDPDLLQRPDPGVRRHALQLARQRFPFLDDGAGGGLRRHDAYAPQGHGVVAPCVGCDDVLVAAGFGGNGVKLAPVVAERVAAWVPAPAPLPARPAEVLA
jgi:glycine/D-amino acid oxidase-like deaminating enzyme